MQDYEQAGAARQRELRRLGLMPANITDAKEPEVYRIYLLCQRTGLPPVAGGVLDQPYVLSRELEAVASGVALYQRGRAEQEKLLSGLAKK